MLLHEKFLQFDWLRTVVFQLNLKRLQSHVKITKLLWVVVFYKQIIAWFVNDNWHKIVIFQICLKLKLRITIISRNITCGIYAKYHYKSCYYCKPGLGQFEVQYSTVQFNPPITNHVTTELYWWLHGQAMQQTTLLLHRALCLVNRDKQKGCR